MIDAIVKRITEHVPDLKLVGSVAEFQLAVQSAPKATPACFVLNLGERRGPVAEANILMQRTQASVGVIFAVRNAADPMGAAASQDLQALRDLVTDQIYGWVPQEGADPLERGNSNLLTFQHGCVWWQDIYSTSYYERSKQ
ncbi:phage tail terminator protein [Pseudoduganella sp. RAF53_2]|uniref:phage tail terminator protein n=1 Tax=unclassified Pseudoduganella TaxID=2637179 RepID=UPI003F951037